MTPAAEHTQVEYQPPHPPGGRFAPTVPAPLHPRLTLVEHLYYARPGQPAATATTVLTTTVHRPTLVDEQPYARQLLLGTEWTRLDHGWVRDPGVLHLRNEEDPPPGSGGGGANADEPPKVVELGVLVNGGYVAFALVHPLFSQRVEPPPGRVYAARCPGGSAQVTLTLLAR